MQDKMRENLLNELRRKNGKRIVICQTGFISTKFLVNCLNYKVEIDTLTIKKTRNKKFI